MRHIGLLWVLLVVLSGVAAADDKMLYPFVDNDLVGFIDVAGHVVVKPQYHVVAGAGFQEGLAGVGVAENRFGFIDITGRLVIPPTFTLVHPFSEGLAGVEIQQHWGFVDKAGKLVIPARYPYAGSFGDGLAAVENDSLRWTYIDATGKVAIPTDFEEAAQFEEGLARVRIDSHYGFIDRTGKLVIAAKFKSALGFEQGLCAVQTDSGAWGYIDKTGNMAIAAQYQEAASFFEHLAAVKLTGRWGYIDPQAKFVIAPQYDAAMRFNGLAAVRVKNKFGFIDHTGRMVVEPRYEFTEGYNERLALVFESADAPRPTYIDLKGHVVWQAPPPAPDVALATDPVAATLHGVQGQIALDHQTFQPADAVSVWDNDQSTLTLFFFATPRTPQQIAAVPRAEMPVSVADVEAFIQMEFDGTPGHQSVTRYVLWRNNHTITKTGSPARRVVRFVEVDDMVRVHLKDDDTEVEVAIPNHTVPGVIPESEVGTGPGVQGTIRVHGQILHPRGAIGFVHRDGSGTHFLVVLREAPMLESPLTAEAALEIQNTIDADQTVVLRMDYDEGTVPSFNVDRYVLYLPPNIETTTAGPGSNLFGHTEGEIKVGNTVRFHIHGHTGDRQDAWNLRIEARIYPFVRQRE